MKSSTICAPWNIWWLRRPSYKNMPIWCNSQPSKTFRSVVLCCSPNYFSTDCNKTIQFCHHFWHLLFGVRFHWQPHSFIGVFWFWSILEKWNLKIRSCKEKVFLYSTRELTVILHGFSVYAFATIIMQAIRTTVKTSVISGVLVLPHCLSYQLDLDLTLWVLHCQVLKV